jgi:serine/threonine-protein kinase
MPTFLRRLRERKIGQWTLAYLAGAFVVVQLLDALETALGLTPTIQRAILVMVVVGFFLTLVLAWYHGEKGRQRASGPELLMVAALLAIAAGVLAMLGVGEKAAEPTGIAAPAGQGEHPLTAIAVLPFQNLSADGPHAYFAGGLHGELLTQLVKVAALKPIGHASVMGYAGANLPPLRQIARELGVGSVVQASVQVVDDVLRVNVWLIDATTGQHLWSETYDRTLDDAFAIQSDVAQQVVVAVGARLGEAAQQSLAEAPTANGEAYRLYLQGLEYLLRPGFLQPNLEIAQGLLERALAHDSTFALAHAMLGQLHGAIWWYDPSPERLIHASEEAETALRLDPDLPEGHAAMGDIQYIRRDWQGALDEYGIALQAKPSDAYLWGVIGYVYRRLGNWDEADAAYERATELDPQNANLHWDLGAYTFYLTRRYPEAIAAYQEALSLAPDLHIAAVFRGLVYLDWRGDLDTLRVVLGQLPPDANLGLLGTERAQKAQLLLWEREPDSLLALLGNAPEAVFRGGPFFLPTSLYAAWAHQMRGDDAATYAAFESARVQLDSALAALPEDRWIHASRGLAMAGLGQREEALQEVRWLRQLFDHREDHLDGARVGVERALILAQAGEIDAALDEIEELLAVPSFLSIHRLRLDPRWDPLRSHPRFQAFLER